MSFSLWRSSLILILTYSCYGIHSGTFAFMHSALMRRATTTCTHSHYFLGKGQQLIPSPSPRGMYKESFVGESTIEPTSTTTRATFKEAKANAQEEKRGEVGMYLLSFHKLYEKDMKMSRASKLLKQWKYYCLGDGGVYFDQRPNTLKALNSIISKKVARNISLAEQNTSHLRTVETSVISTCARFEILIVINQPPFRTSLADVVQDSIIEALVEQISFQKRRISFALKTKLPLSLFDKPRRIRDNAHELISGRPKDIEVSRGLCSDLKDEMLLSIGAREVSNRLCLIAAGLQDRPIFRPFSARDSHIMAQIKRTSVGTAIYSPLEATKKDTSTYCKLLFDSALQCGKAARSSKVVPILEELRQASKGADGPPELSQAAADSAKTLAVDPIVNACIYKLQAMEATGRIRHMRESAMELVEQYGLSLDAPECKSIRTLLHKPTMELREGKDIDQSQILTMIQNKLDEILRHR